MVARRKRRPSGAVITGMLTLLSAITGCSTVPDRSADAAAITELLRSLPAVEYVDGRYTRGMVEGYSYNVDVRMAGTADADQVLAVAQAYHSGITDADFTGHTSRFLLRLGDDGFRMFGNDRNRHSPAAEITRWYQLVRAAPGAVDWAIGPDLVQDLRSIAVDLRAPEALENPSDLVDLVGVLASEAPDLADRQWIVRWRQLRLDLLGPHYPPAEVVAVISDLARQGQWSAVYDSDADPALTLAVWAPSPEQMEQTARAHLPAVQSLGLAVSYTVRANQTPPVQVLVGGCLEGGSQVQQRLNREFGDC